MQQVLQHSLRQRASTIQVFKRPFLKLDKQGDFLKDLVQMKRSIKQTQKVIKPRINYKINKISA